MFWPTSVSQREEVAAHEGKGPVLRKEGEEREGVGLLGPLAAPPPHPSPLSSYPPPHILTYLVPQHALQPILPGSSQVDG